MPEQPKPAPGEEFVLEDWLRDGMKGIRTQFEERLKGKHRAGPDISEFKQHMRNARKEQLLAVRSLLDSAINRLDKSTEGDKPKA